MKFPDINWQSEANLTCLVIFKQEETFLEVTNSISFLWLWQLNLWVKDIEGFPKISKSTKIIKELYKTLMFFHYLLRFDEFVTNIIEGKALDKRYFQNSKPLMHLVEWSDSMRDKIMVTALRQCVNSLICY